MQSAELGTPPESPGNWVAWQRACATGTAHAKAGEPSVAGQGSGKGGPPDHTSPAHTGWLPHTPRLSHLWLDSRRPCPVQEGRPLPSGPIGTCEGSPDGKWPRLSQPSFLLPLTPGAWNQSVAHLFYWSRFLWGWGPVTATKCDNNNGHHNYHSQYIWSPCVPGS